jgi:limonene-1,2-epoxide hydrolase
MMNSPDEVVTRFCALWSKPDLDEIASCFTEDAVYRNIPPTPSVEGREAIREFIAEFLATLDGIDFIVHRQISDHGVVMHERTDVLRRKDGVEISAKMLCRSGVSRRPVSALAEHANTLGAGSWRSGQRNRICVVLRLCVVSICEGIRATSSVHGWKPLGENFTS